MIFKFKKHNTDLYNILLSLSRNFFFYKGINLPDNFETRIYLMFMHFSIFMIISKKKGKKFSQESYDNLFHCIENNLRELGFGDVSVNKKMKELNKIFYDILLKLSDNPTKFNLNKKLIHKYFVKFIDNDKKWCKFDDYFLNFYQFCFDQSNNNMIKEVQNFKY
mgnify:CR=1 FL=1